MNASSRVTREIVVELPLADFELTDVSDRNTDLPVEPPAPALEPLDLDTTQIVPQLVLSELRYQARLRSAAGVAALAPPPPETITVRPPPEPVAAIPRDTSMEIERAVRGPGIRRAIALGVIALSFAAVLFALIY